MNPNNPSNPSNEPIDDGESNTMRKYLHDVYYKAFFESLKSDLSADPVQTEHIEVLLNELVDGLCKFVPSKTTIHAQIKADIIPDTIDINTMPGIIFGLIHWIEQFQAPVHDSTTKQWRTEFKSTTNPSDFIVKFLAEYYEHVEKMYEEVWEARKRLVNNEDVIPPEHRPTVTGTNGIPNITMKTGH